MSAIHTLEDRGLVCAFTTQGRTLYEITPRGWATLREEQRRMAFAQDAIGHAQAARIL